MAEVSAAADRAEAGKSYIPYLKVMYRMAASKTVIILVVLSLFNGCEQEETPPLRTYRMGFQNSAPRFDDFDLFLQSLNLWTTRADAAIITTEVPWEELLNGESAVDYVVENYKGLVEFYREKNFKLWVYVDPQNGLDRTSDALELVAANKSIADMDVQALYRRFVVVMDSVLKPEHLGLALETNLIRDAASSVIYEGVKQAANDVAEELSIRNSSARLSISVQVDHAWGKLVGGTYQGIDQDLADFPFVEELGLSSYPYFGFDDPEDIPIDYYSRLVEGTSLPVFVSEGGWSSESYHDVNLDFVSSPVLQQKYFERQEKLLDDAGAIAWFQLVFTDIDVESLPPDVPEIIGYFAYLGLVDENLDPKPALGTWDRIFGRRIK